MALSTTYNVRANYRANTRGARAEVNRLAESTDNVAERAQRARSSLMGLGAIAKTAIATAFTVGIGLAARHMGRLVSQVENAKISIAGTFNTLSDEVGSFSEGLERASDLYERFRDRSIRSPATSQQFRAAFQSMAPAIAPLGLGNERIAQFVQRSVPAGMAFTGGDFQQLGRDIQMMMQGRAGADVRTFQQLKQPLFDQLGVGSVDEFNQMAQQSPTEVFGAIEQVLTSMDEVNEAFSQTLSGSWASFMELLNQGLYETAKPVFDTIKNEIQGVIGWVQENKDRVDSLAESVGNNLAGAFQAVAGAAKLAAENIELIAGAGLMIAAPQIADTATGLAGTIGEAASGAAGRAGDFFGRSRRAVTSPLKSAAGGAVSFAGELIGMGAFRGGAAPTGRGARLGAAARRLPGRIARGARAAPGAIARGARAAPGALARGARAVPGMLASAPGLLAGGAGSAVSSAASGLTSLVASLGSLAAAVGPAIIVLGMIVGTFRVLGDETSQITAFFERSVDRLMTQLDVLAQQLGLTGDGGTFGSALKKIADWLGGGVVGTLGIVTSALAKFVEGLNWLVATVQGVADGIHQLMLQFQSGGLSAITNPMDTIRSSLAAAHRERRQRQADQAEERRRRREEREDEENDDIDDTAEDAGATTNIEKIEINQEIKQETNPDRIAYSTSQLLMNTVDNARDSVRHPHRS